MTTWGKPGSPSQDIVPIACHSHNDYWRHVPLYDALAAGCTGIEADVWLKDSDLLVGHDPKSLTASRTLKSLYVDPLVSILSRQDQSANVSTNGSSTPSSGVFDAHPNTTLVLLIDIKSDGGSTLREVLKELEPLRSQGWLTYFNGSLVPGPITVVGTGNTPFDAILANTTHRDVFFDAPLDQLWGENAPTNATLYTSENSLYASVSMEKAIGKPWLGVLSPTQMNIIRGQIKAAQDRGLKARYWDTPSWPVGRRDHIWDVLEKQGVGILNVDDLQSASKRHWGG
ncbi:Altered inheritance of mitochondria protein 6 [Puttea exsequens]|nr:Altered inheritance of mitochondria protein 6 [Puttea exsequens]